MLEGPLANAFDLGGIQVVRVCDPDGLQPQLGGAIPSLDVNVRRFLAFVAEGEEPVAFHIQDRWLFAFLAPLSAASVPFLIIVLHELRTVMWIAGGRLTHGNAPPALACATACARDAR